MIIDFQHQQTAHCESGVASSLLIHRGLQISEPLAFGIGSGLFFAHLPFFKLDHIPFTTFRMLPGYILKRVTKLLKIKIHTHQFRKQEKAMHELDRIINQNIPVGLQVGVYWLPFFPKALRFHFNGHNIIVFGKKNENYLISDPTLDTPVICSSRALKKARFAKGPLAPKGKMYYLENYSCLEQTSLEKAIIKGIRRTCFLMLKSPPPFFGVYGIKYLANNVQSWPNKLIKDKAILYLTQVIRMQEEIGTGGAGFRFLYGAFLQEASDILFKKKWLLEFSNEITDIGDKWRDFAILGARICKERSDANETFDAASKILLDCFEREKIFFQNLKKRITLS